MAGVGFELRKSITDKGSTSKTKGYLGAAFSSCGTVIVGIVLFSIITFAAKLQSLSQDYSDQFMCYVTNAMFLSMIVNSVFSMVLSRFVSDALYLNETEKVMPSFIGGTVTSLIFGSTIFGAQLLISNVAREVAIPLFLLFQVLTVNWILMTYITIIRDYLKIVWAYIGGFVTAVLLLCALGISTTLTVSLMIVILLIGFSVIDILLFVFLYKCFHKQDGSVFEFLGQIKKDPTLLLTGFLMMLGMLGHFWIVWFTAESSTTVLGLFRFNAQYDYPAIVAYFSTIPSAIYFITLFETDFSDCYHDYFSALGNGGSVESVSEAKEKMLQSIAKGLRNVFLIQLVSCLLFITFGSKLLFVLNIGMTEDMLSAYRLFCVGYSLYYIGNLIMLLQLYFANERKATWSALLFVLSAIMGTIFESNKENWGLGFMIASAILVLFSAFQLTAFLKKLEYNILCKPSFIATSFKNSVTQTFTRENLIKATTIAMAVVLLVTIGSGTWLIEDRIHQSKVVVLTPTSSDDILLSPGMGLAPWADSDETMELNTSLVYVELRWADWEPENNAFNVEFVNDYYNLEYYREDNRQVVFRFICDEPTEEEHMDIPQWLYDETADGQFYQTEYGEGYSPNYNNELFIAEHAEAISALGEYFGKDDFFVYVELGSLGHWGEWHVYYEAGLDRIPDYSVRQQYIKPYVDAFPNAQLLLRYPLIDAQQYSMGLYNDLTGDYDETLYWLSQMAESVWEQTELLEQADCSNSWKQYPIGGEFAQTYENDYFLKDNFDMTLEAIKQSHQTFIGPKIIIDESDEKYEAQMSTILKTIGYRYRVSEARLDFAAKESVEISVSITNDGIAPIYENYSVLLEICDDEGNAVWTNDDSEIDLKEVLPANSATFTCFCSKEELDDDSKYYLAISIVDQSGNAVVPMAMEETIEKNVYVIGSFSLK